MAYVVRKKMEILLLRFARKARMGTALHPPSRERASGLQGGAGGAVDQAAGDAGAFCCCGMFTFSDIADFQAPCLRKSDDWPVLTVHDWFEAVVELVAPAL